MDYEKEQVLMDKAIELGWITSQGRWWTKDFDPAQNTWTWDRVRAQLFPEEPERGE